MQHEVVMGLSIWLVGDDVRFGANLRAGWTRLFEARGASRLGAGLSVSSAASELRLSFTMTYIAIAVIALANSVLSSNN